MAVVVVGSVVVAVVGPVVGPVVVDVGQGVLLQPLLRLLLRLQEAAGGCRSLQEAGRESGPLAGIPLTGMTKWWSSQVLKMSRL